MKVLSHATLSHFVRVSGDGALVPCTELSITQERKVWRGGKPQPHHETTDVIIEVNQIPHLIDLLQRAHTTLIELNPVMQPIDDTTTPEAP